MFVIYVFCCLEFRAAPKLLMGLHRAGGAGIVLGLALYSSNISRTLGVRVAKITYARGFSAELGTAITVAIASRYGEMLKLLHHTGISVVHFGKPALRSASKAQMRPPPPELGILSHQAKVHTAGLPVSTTQVITGALIAVGLTEGIRGVNWKECFKVDAPFC